MAVNTVWLFAFLAILLSNMKLCHGAMRQSDFAAKSKTDRH